MEVNEGMKVTLLVRCHWCIGGLIGVAVTIYFLITEKDVLLLHHLWIPFLLLSMLEVVFIIYRMFSMTKATTTHFIFSAITIHMIGDFFVSHLVLQWFCFLQMQAPSTGPFLNFACFILVFLVADYFSLFFILK